MKKINLLHGLVLLLMMTGSITATAQSVFKQMRGYYGLRGNVKAMIQTAYEPKMAGGEVVSTGKAKAVSPYSYWATFSPQGWIIESSDINPLGGSSQRTTFKYGHNLKLSKSITTFYNMQDEELNRLEVSFNDEGNPAEERRYMYGIVADKVLYEYNADGLLTKIIEPNKMGRGYQSTVIAYDGINPSDIREQKQNGGVKAQYEYRYNTDGSLYNTVSDNIASTTAAYTYNDLGDVITSSHGNLNAGELVATYCPAAFRPNALNIHADARSYQYEYDANGNWTQCTILKNGKPDMVLKREIEYYE